MDALDIFFKVVLMLFRISWSIDGMRSLCQRSLNTVAKRLLQESKFAFIFNTIII